MLEVVGVRFKEAGKIYYFAPGQESLSRGQAVIVETVRALNMAKWSSPINKWTKKMWCCH